MRILDLFCGAGGAAMGYHLAFPDAEIVGVDINPQPRYPFRFHQGDATRFPVEWVDLIHASPPCQRYSDLAHRNGNAADWPDLVPVMRRRLSLGRVPFVIENVEGAPLVDPVMCWRRAQAVTPATYGCVVPRTVIAHDTNSRVFGSPITGVPAPVSSLYAERFADTCAWTEDEFALRQFGC